MAFLINPEMFKWGRERAGLSIEDLTRKFPNYRDWESGAYEPSRSQVERFGEMAYISRGYLLMGEPFEEDFMMKEFRAGDGQVVSKPSVHLLDLLQLCSRRQEWYREIAIDEDHKDLPFVGSADLDSDPADVAKEIRETIKFDLADRKGPLPERKYLGSLVDKVEAAGILVMISSRVGSNSRRKLDVKEFRGFALCDDIAPLIFVNGADHPPSQIFTLCHELAHIWLGESAFVRSPLGSAPANQAEEFCNEVAAEILVPAEDLESAASGDERDVKKLLRRLKKRYKVANLHILPRLRGIGRITGSEFEKLYESEMAKLTGGNKGFRKGGGSNFYPYLIKASSRKLARSVIAYALVGQILLTEALDLLGVQHTKVIRRMAKELGMR